MKLTIQPNIGKTDRTFRLVLGGVMLLGSFMMRERSLWKRIEMMLGALFLVYGFTGYDPVLKAMGASTVEGAEDHVFNQLKQAIPGQGISPKNTEQALPTRPLNFHSQGKTIKDMLAIP